MQQGRSAAEGSSSQTSWARIVDSGADDAVLVESDRSVDPDAVRA